MSVPGDHIRSGPIGQRSDTLHSTASTVVAPVVDAGSDSAVSWAAIFAGAAAAAALSLILLLLGTGLGLSSVSPWAYDGASAETLGWSTIGWISFTSLAASGLGGYLAGRLRTRWVSVHRDESFFRDTAHGFLSWAVATLLTVGLLTSAIGAIVGAGAKAGATVAGAAASTAATAMGGAAAAGMGAAAGGNGDQGGMVDYWVDALFRTSSPTAAPSAATTPPAAADDATAPSADGTTAAQVDTAPGSTAASTMPATSTVDAADSRREVVGIFLNSLRTGSLDEGDSARVAQLVSERTGLSAEEARARVDDIQARMRAGLEQAETAAKQTAAARSIEYFFMTRSFFKNDTYDFFEIRS